LKPLNSDFDERLIDDVMMESWLLRLLFLANSPAIALGDGV
jgi:hypothetical protein